MPLVSLLLNYFAGLDLERRDQRGLTALMKAAVRDRSECAAALLMAGAWGLGRGSCPRVLADTKSAVIVAEKREVEIDHQFRLTPWRREVCLGFSQSTNSSY